MNKGGRRLGSGRKSIEGKEVKIKLPYHLIDSIENLYEGDSLSNKVRETIKNGIDAKLNNYGVVYTPSFLSDFVSYALSDLISNDSSFPKSEKLNVFDPACGECSLLYGVARNAYFKNRNVRLFGNDVDSHYEKIAVANGVSFFNFDAIVPAADPISFWREKIPGIDLIVENPPWSSEQVYEKETLWDKGYTAAVGQYDAYALFLQMSVKVLSENGYAAFIIPDSIFTSEESSLRRFLLENTDIKIIAKLGEKLFPNVHRATVVIVLKKSKNLNNQVACFRLKAEERKRILSGECKLFDLFSTEKYFIPQSRMEETGSISIDVTNEDVCLMNKFLAMPKRVNDYFAFGRGVEVSKKAEHVQCPFCGAVQGFLSNQASKKCSFCGKPFSIDEKSRRNIIYAENRPGTEPLVVGESIQRYSFASTRYIEKNVPGIVIKKECIDGIPKILVRKTGMGIKAVVDDSGRLYNQTVYSLKPTYKSEDLYFFLALINSRTLYYFHLKTSGTTEWKSHPYITKQTLYSFPLPDVSLIPEAFKRSISEKSKSLSLSYDKDIDLSLEKDIFTLYGLTEEEQKEIISTMNSLPNLGAINEMRF